MKVLRETLRTALAVLLAAGVYAAASDIESSNYSESAASNTASAPNGAPEGMAPSGVNDTIREVMAAIKREWNRSHPTLTSGGSSNAYTLTPTTAVSAYVRGQTYAFITNFANSGAATLNVSSLGAKGITKYGTTALTSGDMPNGALAVVMYDGTQFQLLNPAVTGVGDINGLSALSAVDANADYVPLYDASATANKKVLTKNLRVTETILVSASNETSAITTGTAKVTWRMHCAFTVTSVRASVTTASSSGLPTIDINEAGTTILSTKLTIDANEKTSTTAATAAVISDSALADDAEMTIDFDGAGTGTTGVKVAITGYCA